MEDLLQEGWIATYQAAKNFDPSKNIQFSTYVYPYIKFGIQKYIQRELKNNYNTLPESILSNESQNIFDWELSDLLYYRYVLNLSYREIGMKIGKSHEFVRKQIKIEEKELSKILL